MSEEERGDEGGNVTAENHDQFIKTGIRKTDNE